MKNKSRIKFYDRSNGIPTLMHKTSNLKWLEGIALIIFLISVIWYMNAR